MSSRFFHALLTLFFVLFNYTVCNGQLVAGESPVSIERSLQKIDHNFNRLLANARRSTDFPQSEELALQHFSLELQRLQISVDKLSLADRNRLAMQISDLQQKEKRIRKARENQQRKEDFIRSRTLPLAERYERKKVPLFPVEQPESQAALQEKSRHLLHEKAKEHRKQMTAYGGTIAGKVKDESSGDPIASVEVDIFDETGDIISYGYTDSSGAYNIGNLSAGKYFVKTFRSRGYVDELYNNILCESDCDILSGKPVAVAVGRTKRRINFALSRGGSISGTVTALATANPISNIGIGIYDSSGGLVYSAATDANGSYSVRGLVAGTYFAVALDPDYPNRTYLDQLYESIPCAYENCDPKSGTPIPVTLNSDTSGVNFALAEGGKISGTVRDSITNAPVPNIDVVISDSSTGYGIAQVSSTTTDASGNYTARGLATGNYFARANLRLSTREYIEQLYENIPCPFDNCDPRTGTAIPVTAPSNTTGINFTLTRGGKISGILTDSISHLPIPYTYVGAFDWNHTSWPVDDVQTDAAGNYIVEGLPAGTYFVKTESYEHVNKIYDDISCETWQCNPTTGTPISVSPGSTTPGIDFSLISLGRIAGIVTDSANNQPLYDVWVEIYDSYGNYWGSGVTDHSGSYTTRALPTGTYFARAVKHWSNYLSELYDNTPCVTEECDPTGGTPISVNTGADTTGINFTLDIAGTITGRVTNTRNKPLEFSYIDIYDASGNLMNAYGETDSSGNYSVQGLPSGTYFAVAENHRGYVDELYDNIPCAPACDPLAGNPIPVTAGQSTPNVNFALASSGLITGTIVDFSNHAPLSQISVDVYNATGDYISEGYSGLDGHYTVFRDLPTGTYYALTRNNHGYIDKLYSNIICEGCNPSTGTPISVTISRTTSGINFALPPGGSISGMVRDASTSAPLPGAQVTIFGSNGQVVDHVTADNSGNYQRAGLTPGVYFAVGKHDQYIDQLFGNISCFPSCDPTTGTPVTVASGTTITGIDFPLNQGGTISGNVQSTNGGAPIPNAQVHIYDSSGLWLGSERVDANGNYAGQRALVAGNYFVLARADGFSDSYVDKLYDNTPCPGGACNPTVGNPVVVTMGAGTPGIDFTLDQGGQIRGQVIDASNGIALSSVSIDIYDSTLNLVCTEYTDFEGHYRTYTGLVSGDYYAIASTARDYANQLYNNLPCGECNPSTGTPISVSAGSVTSTIDFALGRGGTISGRITDKNTNYPVSSSVEVYDSLGRLVSRGYSDNAGDYTTAANLGPGNYFVEAQTWNNRYTGQLYDGFICPDGVCDPTSGTPVTVTVGSDTPGIDFQLFRCNSFNITPNWLGEGRINIPYNQVVSATGGLAPYTFAITNGSLPPGLNLDPSGILSGIPTSSGNFQSSVTASDANGCTGSHNYVFTILPDCLFCDDFEDGILNSNWTYQSTWTEAGGTLVGTATDMKAVAIASPVFTGCSMCTVEAHMQTAGGLHNRVSLLGWYQDNSNYVEIMMKQENNQWLLRQRANGMIVGQRKTQGGISPNVTYDVRIAFDGANFQLYVDNALLLTMKAAVPPQGTVGFQVRNTTATLASISID